jgi:hypothetical protein
MLLEVSFGQEDAWAERALEKVFQVGIINVLGQIVFLRSSSVNADEYFLSIQFSLMPISLRDFFAFLVEVHLSGAH